MERIGALAQLDEAVELLEKVVVGLEPELLSPDDVASCLRVSARGANLLSAVQVTVSPRLVGRDRAQRVARLTGSALGEARTLLGADEALAAVPRAKEEFASGGLSLAQVAEIARTEADVPGSEAELLTYARAASLTQLRSRGKAMRQRAQDPEELERRRHEARSFRSWTDELGMTRFSGALEPHLGVPFISRLEAETDRVFKEASRAGLRESHAAYAADAFARMISGTGMGPVRRPELVLLVDLESFLAGSVVPGGVSKIPGVGTISPTLARDLARDAVITALVHDGTEFVRIKRWSRSIPKAIELALELGPPPDFDGPACARCGGRRFLQRDHAMPHTAGGLMSIDNIGFLCGECHREKTDEDRRKGLLGPNPASPKRRPPGRRSGKDPPGARVGPHPS